jgi:hypothetical protein
MGKKKMIFSGSLDEQQAPGYPIVPIAGKGVWALRERN